MSMQLSFGFGDINYQDATLRKPFGATTAHSGNSQATQQPNTFDDLAVDIGEPHGHRDL